MRLSPSVVLLVSTLLSSGCQSTPVHVVATGFDASTRWSVPGSMARPDSYYGGDVSWTRAKSAGLDPLKFGDVVYPAGPTLGAYFMGREGESLEVAYVALPAWFVLYVKPMIGVWRWSESP